MWLLAMLQSMGGGRKKKDHTKKCQFHTNFNWPDYRSCWACLKRRGKYQKY